MTLDKLEIKDGVFKSITKHLIEVNEETNEEISTDILYVYYSNYLDLFNEVYLNPKTTKLEDSLFKYRFLEFGKQFQWLYFNITSGSYHQSIRELRYILESFIQAYYIDKNHPKASMDCKMEILKEVELYGSNLISKTTGLNNNNKKKIKKLYLNLSKHIHSSYENLDPIFEFEEFEHSVTFKFNKRMLLECINLFHETFDAILLLIFLYDPNLSSNLSEGFIEILKSRYKMAYSVVQNQK